MFFSNIYTSEKPENSESFKSTLFDFSLTSVVIIFLKFVDEA